MDNKTSLDTERWVEERMALLNSPDTWEPNADRARARFQRRIDEPHANGVPKWLPRIATVVILLIILIFAIPATRAIARQVWQWLTVPPYEVVQADFDRLKGTWLILRHSHKEVEVKEEINEDAMPERQRDLNFWQAAWRAGFIPHMPYGGVTAITANFMTMPATSFRATLNVTDMERTLRDAGVTDQSIPKEWDGAQIAINIGPVIVASWNGGPALMQHRPVTVAAPPGFDFGMYWTLALRAAGVDREQAFNLASRMRTAPSMLLGISKDEKVAIRKVRLHRGGATLIESLGPLGEVKVVTLIWSVPNRFYMLGGARSAEQAIKIANSIE